MFYFFFILFIFLKNIFFDFFVKSKSNFLFLHKNNVFLNKKNEFLNLNEKLLNLEKKKSKFKESNIKNKCKFNIVIDPGHGGHDPGAIGLNGSREKDITLLISKKLFNFLSLNKKFNVFLIRSKDNYVSLEKRLYIAKTKNVDLFLSIHVNSIRNNKYIKGASIWLLPILSKYKYINKREYLEFNKNNNFKFNYLLFNDKKKNDQLNFNLALEIINKFRNVIFLHKNYLQYADLFVLSLFYVPSILIETGYISNPIEEKKLNNKFYQYKLAKYIYLGVENFVNKICLLKN